MGSGFRTGSLRMAWNGRRVLGKTHIYMERRPVQRAVSSVRRRFLFPRLPPIVLTLAFLFSPIAEAAQIMTGKLADIQGDVKIRRVGSDLERPASLGASVNPGDAVITSASGRAGIQFEHGKLALGNATKMTLLRCMTSRDEVFAELALTAGTVDAYINREKGKELWFDILTPTQLARGEGNKKSETRLTVSHSAGGTTATDSEVGRWKYQPVMITDLPPAVQAVLTDNAKASTMMKTYVDTALSQSALTAYEVTSNAGAPDVGAAQAPVTSETTPAPAVTPSVTPVVEPSAPVPAAPPPKPSPLSLTLTPKGKGAGVLSQSATVTSADK